MPPQLDDVVETLAAGELLALGRGRGSDISLSSLFAAILDFVVVPVPLLVHVVLATLLSCQRMSSTRAMSRVSVEPGIEDTPPGAPPAPPALLFADDNQDPPPDPYAAA